MKPDQQPSLADRIDALLPQTQCTRCGFQGCRPYAQAIADGQADINRCPPGGELGILALAALLQRPAPPLDPECGPHQPFALAFIDEDHCIGCTLCIQACPVDAIVGANKHLHTVLPDHCTGCELCIPPCPVDCISMVPAPFDWTPERADQARQRHLFRQARLARQQQEHVGAVARNLVNKASLTPAARLDEQGKQAIIAEALARARARRQARGMPAQQRQDTPSQA